MNAKQKISLILLGFVGFACWMIITLTENTWKTTTSKVLWTAILVIIIIAARITIKPGAKKQRDKHRKNNKTNELPSTLERKILS